LADDNLCSYSHLKEIHLKRLFLILSTLLATALSSNALAQDARQLNIRSLAATCANCHGTNGKAQDGSAVVSLAGLPKDYIVAQMAAFKSGARPATVMHQLAKGYSDAQIEQIAGYFAAQKK
jgi:cytochrome subunit of sulfide dehydrogenase